MNYYSGTSSIRPNTGSSSEPVSPAVALTNQSLHPNTADAGAGKSNKLEIGIGTALTITFGIIGAIVYFFVTVISIKEEISTIKALVAVQQNEQAHIQSELIRINKTIEKLGDLGNDVAVLKASSRNGDKDTQKNDSAKKNK